MIDVADTEESLRARAEVAAGRLPARYAERWKVPFFERVQPAIAPGIAILDVGSGRTPTIPPDQRPPDCRYVGLDISATELSAAPEGSYDEKVVGDLTKRDIRLENRFDLIVSWQVLEHVVSLESALENLHAYLRPGGRLVSQLSGSFAVFALMSRIIPHRVSVRLMERLLGIEPETKFQTQFDRCYHRALQRLLSDWQAHEIVPRYNSGGYFAFSGSLLRLYLVYENWLARTNRRNLATHYLIVGGK